MEKSLETSLASISAKLDALAERIERFESRMEKEDDLVHQRVTDAKKEFKCEIEKLRLEHKGFSTWIYTSAIGALTALIMAMWNYLNKGS